VALAYLITWAVYGTWLPGDRRKSVSEENRRGAPFERPNPARVAYHRELLQHRPHALSQAERATVENTIREVCEIRGWSLRAVNARSNHVHTVVSCSVTPEKVLVDLKSWATRRLRAMDPDRFEGRVWTKHGSARHLFDAPSVKRAIEYVQHHQERA